MKKIILAFLISEAIFSLAPVVSQAEIVGNINIGSFKSVVTAGFSFKKDLILGDQDPDIQELQRVLNADASTTVAIEGAGAKGRETTYFGPATQAAVIKFQIKYQQSVLALNDLPAPDGMVNKATRTRLNLLLGVFNTYDSSGRPQGHANPVAVSALSSVATLPIVTPVITPAATATCQVIDLLIARRIIANPKVKAAQNLACPAYLAGPAACDFVSTLVKKKIITKAKQSAAQKLTGCEIKKTNTVTNDSPSDFNSNPASFTVSWPEGYNPGTTGVSPYEGDPSSSLISGLPAGGYLFTVPTATSTTPKNEISFGGQIIGLEPCLDSDGDPIPHKFEMAIAGYPVPGARGIYDNSKFPKASVGFFVLGAGSGKGGCEVSHSRGAGFKNVGKITTLGVSPK